MVATASGRRVHVAREESAAGRWELVRTTPAPRLAPLVREYCAYHEQTPGPSRRRELPGPKIVLIFDLGPTLRLLDDDTGARVHEHHGGFAAGLDDRMTLTETQGEQRGIQVDLEPGRSCELFGVAMHELAGRIVRLDDVFGAEARRLHEQLSEARDWHARFLLLDRFFSARLRDDDADGARADWVEWAWRRLVASGGTIEVDTLAREVGYSRKHLSVSFRERFGMSPKPLARVIRFDRAVQLLRSGRFRSFADVALACGYYDQAHFTREFHELAGCPPGEYVTPWPAVTSVQDAGAPAP
jgi:AraC-like DNA-binding protein